MNEIDHNTLLLEVSISNMIKKLIEDKNKGNERAAGTPETQPTGTGPTETGVMYPNLKSDFFEKISPMTNWWEDIIFLLAFMAMVFLSFFVFCRGYEIMITCKEQSGFLLFFFGMTTLLLVGLVLLAFFMIKASAKRHSELSERENKQLLFRQKMIETVFELENRNIIAEKRRSESEVSMKEKGHLYSLDERQRVIEHDRKMQMRGYELVESYMKHVVDLKLASNCSPQSK